MKHLLLTTIAAVVLVGCGNPDGALIQAAKDGNIEAVKQHLAKDTDVNAKSGPVGRTPLHEAALRGHKEVVELLIDKVADVNAKNWDGLSPLHYAALTGRKETAELLISEGADVNARGTDDETPLGAAEYVDENYHSPEDKAALKETAELLRKHGGKTGEELKAEV